MWRRRGHASSAADGYGCLEQSERGTGSPGSSSEKCLKIGKKDRKNGASRRVKSEKITVMIRHSEINILESLKEDKKTI